MRAFFAEGHFETDEGERLTLVCDFSALDVIEGITGQNWDEIVPQLVKPPRGLAVKVLYGLLRKRHVDVGLDDVAGLFFDKNSIALWAVMGDVIARACNFDAGGDGQPSKKKAEWSIACFRKEWIASGFDPGGFWNETPRSFVNAMEGAAIGRSREYDASISQAWHTAIFGLNGYAGKLKGKSLSDYLTKKPQPRSSAARAIAFFHSMQSAGFPVTITRVERAPPQ